MKRIILFLTSKEKKTAFSNDYLIGEFLLALLLIVISILFPLFSKAQKDKDGALNYSPGISTTYILNRYSALASTASSGSTTLSVSNIAQLSAAFTFTNSANPYTTTALSAGDLVMIIQMQGADITTTDDANYGTITAYNNVGAYELRTVQSINSNTLTFCTPLSNTYTVSGRKRAQVVRVPRLSSLTVGSNAIVTAYVWDGTFGGICAIEVNGNAIINGSINVNGDGFAGGTDPDWDKSSSGGATIVTLYRTTAIDGGTTATAGKGESIVGTIADYASLNGANGRGAPANGGGGGNGKNAGGGGGSNCGNNSSLTPWDGTGIKDLSGTSWNLAWDLEATGFATSISRGGGRGGYSNSTSNQNAITLAPSNSSWSGDRRDNVGGFGGRPLDYSINTRLFLGGGGGGGEGDGKKNGNGGNGGGVVCLLVNGTVSGSGIIRANGSDGGATTANDKDAAGGAGGGGAIVVLSNSTITSVTMEAKGGIGGSQTGTLNEANGPGGGGGGGYILTTTTSVTRSVAGGGNGISTSPALTEFTPNGSTQGDAGTIVSTGVYYQPNDCYNEINGITPATCTPGTGSVAASGTILNSYYPGTASAARGATRISVGTKNLSGSTNNISPGDLLLVIQMQGSTINSTNSTAYGSGGSGFSGYLTTVAGTFEYVYAMSAVISGTVYIANPLKNAYTNADATATAGQYRFQVVRVPQYSSLNIAVSASITNAEWNGSSGGIIAANISGTTTFNGGIAITASNLGFRGGGGRQLGGGSGASTDAITLSSNNANASKGEGIAGTPKYTRSLAGTLVDNGPEGYPNGSYAQGAPGNAGGGGTDGNIAANDENTGGGGGGNGGSGGRGGRGWNDPAQYGGYGGAVFTQASATRLVMGGGGGAGTTNNGTAVGGGANVSVNNGFNSSGGSGGGMIFFKTGSVSGTGTIEANGANGLGVDNDGGGAGGAGGSVYFYSTNTTGMANITINAKGGAGGNAWANTVDNGIANDGDPEHGPGGGGGGGVIYSNATVNASSSVAGGSSGITTTSNLPYGAATGATGIILTSATDLITISKTYCDIDDDNDGIIDTRENPSSVDPFEDADNDGIPNVYDSNSGTVVAWADTNSDGVNDNYDSDKDGIINELDIDSDNDGITDNVEAQSTTSYKVPSDVDIDGDGLNDLYELPSQIGLPTGSGLTPYDHDGDGIPDYLDTDTDNDGVPDRNEGDRNSPFVTITQATIDASGDTDGDGLMDVFDNINSSTLTPGNLYKNVTMGNMGPGVGFTDNFNGPTPSGSLIGLQKSDLSNTIDRDWRNAVILPLHVVSFSVNYKSPFATIKWNVVNELQTNYYDIEFSTNGINYNFVERVSAKNMGTSSYSYPHNLSSQTSGIFYYKIKQVDKDGKVYYTQIVVIRINKQTHISVSPNPFKSFINISYQSDVNEKIIFQLISLEGKILLTKYVDVAKGINSIQIADLGYLPAGAFFLRVQSAINLQNIKLIKER